MDSCPPGAQGGVGLKVQCPRLLQPEKGVRGSKGGATRSTYSIARAYYSLEKGATTATGVHKQSLFALGGGGQTINAFLLLPCGAMPQSLTGRLSE